MARGRPRRACEQALTGPSPETFDLPRATAQLLREIMEYASADHAMPAIDRNTLTHLLLSITTEQDSSDEFAGVVPTVDEIAALERRLPKMDADETLEYPERLIQDEIASSLFNDPLKLEMCCRTRTTCGSPRGPPRSKTTGLGPTPADAFKIATGVELLDVMRLGHRIIKRSSETIRWVHSRRPDSRRRLRGRDRLPVRNMTLSLDGYQEQSKWIARAGKSATSGIH